MSGERAEQRRPFDWWAFLGPLAGAILGVGVTLVILDLQGVLEPDQPAPVPPPRGAEVAATPTTAPVFEPSPGERVDVVWVAESVTPSIVTVVTSGTFPSTGSGVVYREDGFIITNHHVVDVSDSHRVEFADGSTYQARLVGSDALTDLAVLAVDRSDAVPLPLASAEEIRIGQTAVAVGNPLGLTGGPSVTAGVISALGRSLDVARGDVLYGLIQTDAPITRGSSGGALVDGQGRLLGITTAIGVSDVGAEGLGFAIPVDLVQGVIDELIATGTVRHAMLGIRGETAEEVTEAGAIVPFGAQVTQMTSDSALQEAGGRLDDVIVALEGRRVGSMEELIARLRHHRAGERVTVTILREGEDLDLEVTLGARA